MNSSERITDKTRKPQAVKPGTAVLSTQGYLALLLCLLFLLFYGCSLPTIRLIDPSTKLMPCDVSIKDNRAEKTLFPIHSLIGTQYWHLDTDLESAFCNRISKSQLPIIIKSNNLSVRIEVDSLNMYLVDSDITHVGTKCEIIGKVNFTNINGQQFDKSIHAQHLVVASKFNKDDGDKTDVECANHFWKIDCTVMNITIDKFIDTVYKAIEKKY
ncbi:MAG: hypothetical protein H8E10_13215 [Desulfobacterales bacterium]|nr:hypothetical protein [Desulfobacterales bacterium]